MNKNIIIVILLIITVFFLLYAFIKADEAAKAGMAANVAQQEAAEQTNRAEEHSRIALEAAALAKMNEAKALDLELQLKECQSK